MRHHKWTEEKLSALAKLFPVESTKHTATVLQMSVTAVKGKAKELGLKKETKSEWAKRADYVRSHFYHCSLSEMAGKLGISRTSVIRIMKSWDSNATKEQNFQVTSRVRSEIIRRERRHVLFGLAPVTKIKVVSNRRVFDPGAVEIHRLYRKRDSNTLYYTDKIERKGNLETRGIRQGLRFLPFSEREPFILTAYKKREPCNTDK